jgi:hypothetical protein
MIGYNDYRDFLASVRLEFDSAKGALFNEYSIIGEFPAFDPEAYDAFRHRYRNLRQVVIQKVLARFRSFLPRECLIYEFGSLTKFTDRIESDIDLTICYDSPKTEAHECAEELIDYTIATVFRQSIDNIHGKFQHYPMDRRHDALTEADNLYALQFGSGRIEYKCGPETLHENLMHIKNTRDYRSLLDGYKEKYALRCNIDCLYSIVVLENTTCHDFIGDLAALEANNDIFDDYQYEEHLYFFADAVEISSVKRAFKDTVVTMYTMIAYFRRRANWLHRYSMTMDDVFQSVVLRELFGDNYLARLRQCLLLVLFYWDKIELMLKQKGIRLSTRCHLMFSRRELNAMLYREYHTQNMMEDTESAINSLNCLISDGWRKISCMRLG